MGKECGMPIGRPALMQRARYMFHGYGAKVLMLQVTTTYVMPVPVMVEEHGRSPRVKFTIFLLMPVQRNIFAGSRKRVNSSTRHQWWQINQEILLLLLIGKSRKTQCLNTMLSIKQETSGR